MCTWRCVRLNLCKLSLSFKVSNSGGFGKPSTKTNKTTIMKKDLKSKQIHKSSLGMDDFRTAAMRGNFDVIKSFVEQGKFEW